MNSRFPMTSCFAILATTMIAQASQVWYVDAQGGLNGNGLAWSTAFADLAEALESAESGDEIWVRSGLYQPLIPAAGSADSGYLLADGVSLYGGFIGTESQRSQRDPAINTTTLSAGLTDEVLHVLEGNNLGPSTIIDGFTITDGTGGDDDIGGVGGIGGGIRLINSSPTVIDCIITGNSARLGSGVYSQDGSPLFERCQISGNTSARSGEGGGIYATVSNLQDPQTLTIIDCEINFNSVRQGHFATGNGGGIFADEGIVLTVTGTSFLSNYTWHNGTFGNATVGGAIANLGDGAYIESCSFITGYSNIGAGIYSSGDIQIVQSLFVANRAVGASTCGGFDCPSDVPDVVSGFGGAIYVNRFDLASIDQCTIASNWAADSGAGAAITGSINNSILWDNLSPQPCCGEDPLPVSRMQYEGDVQISYSCVQGLLTPVPGEDPPNPNNFPGSHELNPNFTTPTTISSGAGWLTSELGDHRPQSGSPTIDAGSNALTPSSVLTDLDGFDRYYDDPNTTDTGPNAPPVVDMGAYEYHPTAQPCIADLNNDGELDFLDISEFLSAYTMNDPDADLNTDGEYDFLDISTFLGAYTAGCP